MRCYYGCAVMTRLLRVGLFLLSVTIVLANESLPLHNAARSGDIESLQLHLKQGADPNRKDKGSNKFTALHVAVEHGQVEIARLLLDNGAKVNAQGENDWTALHVAAQHGQVEIAGLLLDNGAKINAWSTWNGLRAPLFVAVEQNQVDVVRLLLERGAKPNRELVFSGFLGITPGVIPLLAAIHHNGNAEIARLLIDHGGQLESRRSCPRCEEELARLEQLSNPPATASPITERRPLLKRGSKAARENINLVGMRDITGIINNFSMKEEVEIGRELTKGVDRSVKIIDDPMILEYVNRIGQNLAKNSDLKVPLQIKVVQDPSINAFALPGGFFYINSGLIVFARDEAELAGVMAHEIAHIAGRHGTRQISQMELIESTANALIEGFGGDNWGTVIAVNAARVALPLTFLSFSRTFENKADVLGMQYLYKTGYDPLAMVTFFERLTARATEGKGAIVRAFSSHPPSEKRATLLMKAIDELLPDRPTYAITSNEFEMIKAAITERYAGLPEDPEESAPPEIVKR